MSRINGPQHTACTATPLPRRELHSDVQAKREPDLWMGYTLPTVLFEPLGTRALAANQRKVKDTQPSAPLPAQGHPIQWLLLGPLSPQLHKTVARTFHTQHTRPRHAARDPGKQRQTSPSKHSCVATALKRLSEQNKCGRLTVAQTHTGVHLAQLLDPKAPVAEHTILL